MTIEQFYEDALALIKTLLTRFGKKKLLLLGHSWGGLLATRLAERHPELLHAVILMNSTMDNVRGEDLSYTWALERAREKHDDKAIRRLERLGASDTYTGEGRFVERNIVFRYGGLIHSDPLKMVRLMLEAPEYSIADCIRNFRMKALSFSIPLMADELMSFNLIEEVRRLEVPVFLFLGRHDHTAPPELSEEFYAALQAPDKGLIWFEGSAHTPDLDEPERFQREVVEIGEKYDADLSLEERSNPIAAQGRAAVG
jgi:pimeloyl-ACP methyl ester carboxylesterase